MPKLNRYKKKDDPDSLEGMTSQEDREKYSEDYPGYWVICFMRMYCIRKPSIVSLKYSESLDFKKIIYLRSYKGRYASEATIAEYIHGRFYCLLGKETDLEMIKKIKDKQPIENDIKIPKFRQVA